MIKKFIPIFTAFILTVSAICYAGPQATIMLTVTLSDQLISNLADAPDAFSPNSDSNYDTTTISYQLSANSYISVNIYDQSNNLIRVLKNNVAENAGVQSVVWDGRNSVGSIVEDGTYTYQITSASETKSGQITVDNKFLNLIMPEDNSIVTIGGQLVFYAIPSRNVANISIVKLYYRPQGTQDWIEPNVDFEQHANGNLFCVIDNIEGNDGDVVETAIFMQYQDLNGQIRQEYTVPITLTFSNEFNIFTVYSSPNAFSPNGDNDFDNTTIFFSINRDAVVSLKIYDINNNLIRIVGENVSAPFGDIDVPWDGRDDSSNIQSDGEYIYRITADDGIGNVIEKQGSVFINNHFMSIAAPVSGTTISGQVTFKAITSDSVFQESNVLFYARQNGQVEWNAIDDENPPVKQTDGSWTQIIDTSGGLNADTEIRVGADYYSHDNELRREYSLPVEYVIFNNLHIIESDISVNPFSPNADGQYDTTAIEYRINAPASVTIKIYDSSSNLVRTLQENVAMSMGENSAAWDGRDDSLNPVPEGTYTYEIIAVDAQQTLSDTAGGTVLIDNHFMQITAPAGGSNLIKDVTLVAMPSANTQNPQNVVFSYRVQDSQTWTNISPLPQKQANNSWTVDWNVDSLSSGNYEIRVYADYNDLDNRYRSEYSTPNSYLVPDYVRITNVSDSPNAFSPNNDTQFDANTLTYNISRVSTVKISVYDQNNTLIRTLKDNVSETAGTQTAVWDGRNDLGTIVADGAYSYLIEATDADSYQAQYQKSVAVDNNILLFEPNGGNSISGQAVIKVIPSSYVNVQGVWFYYRLFGENNWINFGNGVKQGDDTWTVIWDTNGLENNDYEVYTALTYFDLDNSYRNDQTLPITYHLLNGINIFNISDSPDSFSPNADQVRDIATISYQIVNNAGAVTIKIYDASNNLVRTLKDQVTESVGDQIAGWDGNDDQGDVLVDGVYTYIIEAIDSANNVANAQGEITLDNHPLTVLPSDDVPVTGVVHVSATPSQYCQNIRYVYFTVNHQTLGGYFENIGQGALQSDGSWTTDWDTSELIDGVYEYRSSIYYYDQDRKSREDRVYSYFKVANGNLIIDVSDSPDPISPNGDSRYEQTQIKYTLGIESDVSIYLIDENNNNIRTLQPNTHLESKAYPYSIFWDGKDDNGHVVPDGIYTYKINAVHQPGHEETEEGTISVDTHFATIIEPLPENSLNGVITFKIQPSPYVSSVSSIRIYAGYTQLGSAVQLPDQTWNMVWDTASINNGNYKIRMFITYLDREGKSRSDSTPEIEYSIANNMTISRNAFSPNGDSKYDTTTIFYNMASEGIVTIKLFDQNSNIVRILKDNETVGAGLNSVIWDGKDNLDAFVDDGVYTYTIDCEFNSGGNEHQEGTVTVDNHFMRIISPVSGQSIDQTVSFNLEKSSYITDVSSVSMYYRRQGASDWIRFKSSVYKQTLSQWLGSWDTTEISNGDYEVRIYAQYKDMNGLIRTEYSMPNSYHIANAFSVTKVFDSPDAFSPNGDNNSDASTIKYFINSDATVSIRVYDSGSNLLRTLKENIPETAGDHSTVWDGKDQTGTVLNDGTYIYVIEATDNQGTFIQQNGESSVDNNIIYIEEPVPESIISGQVNLKINFSSFASRELNVYLETISLQRNYLRYAVKDNNGSWSIPIDTKIIPNGTFEFKLVASYYDQNNTSRYEYRFFTYSVYNEGADISDLTVTPNPFSPDGSGTWIDLNSGEVFQEPAPGLILDDEVIISFNASDYGIFDIKIIDQDGKTIKQLNSNVLYPDPQTQRIEVIWDGSIGGYSYDQKAKNGIYRVVVNPGSLDKEIFHDIIVDKIPFIVGTYVSPNPFTPLSENYNTTSISYSILENAYVDIDLYAGDVLVTNIQNNVYLESGTHHFIWDGRDAQGQIVGCGTYKIVVNAHTELGAQAYPARLPLFIMGSTVDVRISSSTLNPYDSGASVEVYYTISGDVPPITMVVYNDNDEPVRTLVNNEVRLAGEQVEVWDGKDDSGVIVPDGFYYFKITSNIDGQEYVQYDPSHTDGADISHSLAVSISDFDPKKNIPCTLDVDVPEPVYIFVRIRPGRYAHDDSATIRVLKYKEPYAEGHFQFYWDGRDESGALVPYSSYFMGVWAYRPNVNSVLVVGGAPNITLDADSISPVRFRPYANPYRSSLTLSQTTVSFTISLEALVNVGVYNSMGILVASLAEEELMSAGRHSLYWNGYSDDGELLPKGDYRVVIQAHNEQNYSDLGQLNIELGF